MCKRKDYEWVFQYIASVENTTASQVRSDMERAIREAYQNVNSQAHDMWACIPHKGEMPTPEEVIAYLVNQK